MACTCDYSYTCPECQQRIDAENHKAYMREWHAWVATSLKALALQLHVALDPVPEEPEEH